MNWYALVYETLVSALRLQIHVTCMFILYVDYRRIHCTGNLGVHGPHLNALYGSMQYA